jgi:methyltransferase (TIGR00027 family)
MPRTDDDDWDLTSGVGVTATIVAAGRAMATRDPRGLINDPFAEPLVRAVGLDFFTKMMDGELDMSAIGDVSPTVADAMVAGNAVRTKYFDEYFRTATDGGIRQVAILASGLDARAFRLPWPSGTVVYEIDQPQVLEFKTKTLDELGAHPSATWHAVTTDLRADWLTPLQAAGFDSSVPTAWLAEGLLMYLKPEAQDRLLDNITALSPPGSMVATEFVCSIMDFDADRARAISDPFRDHGVDVDLASLIYSGERNHVLDYLAALGWQLEGVPLADLFRRCGLDAPATDDDTIFISGALTDRPR